MQGRTQVGSYRQLLCLAYHAADMGVHMPTPAVMKGWVFSPSIPWSAHVACIWHKPISKKLQKWGDNWGHAQAHTWVRINLSELSVLVPSNCFSSNLLFYCAGDIPYLCSTVQVHRSSVTHITAAALCQAHQTPCPQHLVCFVPATGPCFSWATEVECALALQKSKNRDKSKAGTKPSFLIANCFGPLEQGTHLWPFVLDQRPSQVVPVTL